MLQRAAAQHNSHVAQQSKYTLLNVILNMIAILHILTQCFFRVTYTRASLVHCNWWTFYKRVRQVFYARHMFDKAWLRWLRHRSI